MNDNHTPEPDEIDDGGMIDDLYTPEPDEIDPAAQLDDDDDSQDADSAGETVPW